MAVVTLTENDIVNSLIFVHKLRENKKHFNVVDRKFDDNNSSYSVNLMGRLGEVAAAISLGLKTDDTIIPSGDNGNDLVTPSGKTIQVKTSSVPKLIFNSAELFVSDVAVLVLFVGDKRLPHVDSEFNVMGYVDHDSFIANHYLHDYGYGTRLVMDADQLQPIEGLANEISRLH
jgi:hypothetical protein